MAVCAQRLHHSRLLLRRKLRKDRDLLHTGRKLLVRKPFQLLSQEQPARRDSYHIADTAGHLLIVAGQHLRLYSIVMKSLYRSGRGGLGQVKEGQISDQNHIFLILRRKRAHRRRIRLLGQSQHAQAPFIQLSHALQHLFPHLSGQGDDLSVILGEGRDLKHFLCRSFCDHLPFPLLILHHNTHAAALKIKGNLIDLRIVFLQILKFRIALHQCLGPLDDSPVQKIAKSCLVPAVQKRMAQNSVVFLSVYIQMALQHNLILCQRSRLIGAENIHGTKVLDRIDILHDHLLAAHGHSSPGQAGSHNHRQHFRRKADGNGNREQNGMQPVSFYKTVQKQNHRNHNQHQAHEKPGHRIYSLFKGGLRPFSFQLSGHAAQNGSITDSCHDALGASADHIASHKSQAGPLERRRLPAVRHPCLFHRLAFSRQRRLAHEQILCLQYPQIRRDHVTGRQMDDVSHHNLFYGNFPGTVLHPFHAGGGAEHLRQPCGRIAAPGLLHQAENPGYQHHNRDDDHRRRIFLTRLCPDHFCKKRNQGQRAENQRKGIHKRFPDSLAKRMLLPL